MVDGKFTLIQKDKLKTKSSNGGSGSTISGIPCASLLLSLGIPMKQIQEWLGHSNFSTAADLYAHLDYASGDAIAGALGA